MSGRWTSTLGPNYRRQAAEIYWKIRSQAEDVRRWLTAYYRGRKDDQEWRDLWLTAESADTSLQEVYERGFRGYPAGYGAVCAALDADDRVEGWLTRISAAVTYSLTGERSMLDSLQASKAPGATDLAPGWAVGAARDTAQAEFKQLGRLEMQKGQGLPTSGAGRGEDSGGDGSRRPRRRRAAGKSEASGPGGQPPKPKAGQPAGGGRGGGF